MSDLRIPQTIPFVNVAWDDALFLIFATLVLGAALMTVIGRNIIRSGLWMILSFAALAGVYVLLGAPLVAAAQVLIYIGAISVLVLFAIMLTQSKGGPAKLVFHSQWWAGALAAFGLAILFALVIASTAWPGVGAERIPSPTPDVARLLFREYVLPLEVVSVLLLAAVIGGVFLAKREDSTNVPQVDRTGRPGDRDESPGGYSGRVGGGIGSADPSGGAPPKQMATPRATSTPEEGA